MSIIYKLNKIILYHAVKLHYFISNVSRRIMKYY